MAVTEVNYPALKGRACGSKANLASKLNGRLDWQRNN
jgi:hypothetical protein